MRKLAHDLKPGGGAPEDFLNLCQGTLGTDWLSNSLVLLVAAVAIIWIPLRRSKLGLRIYATGSDRVAAFRSGVNVEVARFAAYVISGMFASLGGLGLTMSTGIGAPKAGVIYTLSGLAAVLGAVATQHLISPHDDSTLAGDLTAAANASSAADKDARLRAFVAAARAIHSEAGTLLRYAAEPLA